MSQQQVDAFEAYSKGTLGLQPAAGPPMTLILRLNMQRQGTFKDTFNEVHAEWERQGRPFPPQFDGACFEVAL